MSRKSEAIFSDDLIGTLRRRGALCMNFVGSMFMKSGIPDHHVSLHGPWKGERGWIELKVGNKRPNGAQEEYIDEMCKRGTPAVVITARGGVGKGFVVIETFSRDRAERYAEVSQFTYALLTRGRGDVEACDEVTRLVVQAWRMSVDGARRKGNTWTE